MVRSIVEEASPIRPGQMTGMQHASRLSLSWRQDTRRLLSRAQHHDVTRDVTVRRDLNQAGFRHLYVFSTTRSLAATSVDWSQSPRSGSSE